MKLFLAWLILGALFVAACLWAAVDWTIASVRRLAR